MRSVLSTELELRSAEQGESGPMFSEGHRFEPDDLFRSGRSRYIGNRDRRVACVTHRGRRGAVHAASFAAAGRNWALSVHGFKLFFDSRGNFDTGFENCMLPGNINERIVTFANKHKGFEGHLFLKTGQIGG